MGKKICGVLEENNNIFFVVDNFQCTFINKETDSISKTIVTQRYGFILGKVIGETVTDQFIYIYTAEDIEVCDKKIFNTWLYLLSGQPSLEKYMGVRFQGGILKKLYLHSQWDVDYMKDKSLNIKFSGNREKYTLNNEKLKGTLSIGSNIQGGRSREKGSSLSMTPTELELAFENDKSLETFPEIFGYIMNLCRFMAFRKGIRFDEINLTKRNSDFPKPFDKIATCYIRYDEPAEITKGILRCLTFNDLDECVVDLLNNIVINGESKEKKFNINFIPENDGDVNRITSMKIREVFSAIEAELNIHKIKNQTDEEFDNLIKNLKQTVKEHKEGYAPLRDSKDYDYIIGMIDQMYGAMSNRIYILMEKYKSLTDENLSKTQIDNWVKYRNNVTHGEFQILDQEIAESTLVLIRLIYCSILKRIGMKDDKIINLFINNILS